MALMSQNSHYRPAFLFVVGAFAALSACLIYARLRSPSPGDLRRSNAVRRPRNRTRRSDSTNHGIQQRHPTALRPLVDSPIEVSWGHFAIEFEFFDSRVALDPGDLIAPAELRSVARRALSGQHEGILDNLVHRIYDAFLDSLLLVTFPTRPLVLAEREAYAAALNARLPAGALSRALNAHALRLGEARFGDEQASVATTEASWHALEDPANCDTTPGDGQTLRRALYYIAQDRARHEGVVHRHVVCSSCDTRPIRGVRWRCANCVDFDLCSDCEATTSHDKTHVFYKIHTPVPFLVTSKQSPIYPGRPQPVPPSLGTLLKRRLVSETNMEGEELEGLWTQFTCLATAEWKDDPWDYGWALDRRGFNQVFLPKYSSGTSTPNLVCERVFAYYDTNGDGLVGFEEFVRGLRGLHSDDPEIRLKIVFRGYDINGDGLISRQDVLRLFRAFYAIEKNAIGNFVSEDFDDLSVGGALETIRSMQPLSSAFTQGSVHPHSLHDRGSQKSSDNSEGVQYANPTNDDIDDVVERMHIIANTMSRSYVSPDCGFKNSSPAAPTAQENAVSERWQRRQFYLDEEEGMGKPANPGAHGAIYPTNDLLSGVHARTTCSRSSSKVRFQADLDTESRSHTSASSRPLSERWGRYDVPEPEKDLGKEILYQLAQQSFNELLDPMFSEKETSALEVFATKTERDNSAPMLETMNEEFEHELIINQIAVEHGPYRYCALLVHFFVRAGGGLNDLLHLLRCAPGITESEAMKMLVNLLTSSETDLSTESRGSSTRSPHPSALQLWNAKLARKQLWHEITSSLLELFIQAGWIRLESHERATSTRAPRPRADSCSTSATNEDQSHINFYRDPTLPQHRPDNLEEMTDARNCLSRPQIPRSWKNAPCASSMNINASSASDDNPLRSVPFFVGPGRVEAVLAHDPSFAESAVENTPALPESQPQAPTSIATTFGLCCFILNTVEPSLRTDFVSHAHTPVGVDSVNVSGAIRAASSERSSPGYFVWLASLGCFEREVEDRKGSGLLNYQEFEDCMLKDTNLAFLEFWIDLIAR